MAGIDTSAAEAFEKYLVPPIFGPWSRLLVDQVAPQPGERFLDVACGTGAAARHAAALLGTPGAVAAIDIDAGMVAVGRSLDPKGEVEWRQGDALALPWPDGRFDVVVCHQGLQFFPDRGRALAEMHRVLRSDGRLGLSVYCALPYCPGHWAVARALERHDVDPAGILRPYSLGDAVALGDMVQAAGFRDVAVVRRQLEARFASPRAFVESLAAGGPSSRHALEQLTPEAFKAVLAEVAETLTEFVDDAGVRIITTTHFAVARR